MMGPTPEKRPNGAALGLRKGTEMDVTLHLGAHRCATTTFQYYLRHNADRLGKRNIGFWGPLRTRKGLFSGIQPGAISAPGKDAAKRGAGRVRLACARSEAAGVAHLLVSDENMLGTMRENLRAGDLYAGAGERIARFCQAFDGRVHQVVLNIRSLDLFWASGLGFALTRGYGLPRPALLSRLADNPRSWRDVITDIACAAGDVPVNVLPFETYAGRPDAQLKAICHAPAPSEHARIWLNATPPLPELRDHVDARIGAQLPNVTGRWMPFDRYQVAALRERYADDIMWLTAGADGLAKLVGDTQSTRVVNRPGPDMTEGSTHDHERRRMA